MFPVVNFPERRIKWADSLVHCYVLVISHFDSSLDNITAVLSLGAGIV